MLSWNAPCIRRHPQGLHIRLNSLFMFTIEEQFIQAMSNPNIYSSVSKAMYLILNR